MGDAPSRAAGLLGDRYVLEDLVGRGGMAEVYRAHDRMLDRPVAVKLMRAVIASESERARFTVEARTLARLSHPGLVTILDAATTDDEPYLVMELVQGPSLAECCRGVALEPARVAVIGAQLAEALGHAHAAGVVHRDLKPGNVLLDADDRALLTDFGLARLLSETVRHTTTGVTVGTPAYLAPEQVRGEEVTPAADVYSLGLVLLEALTGRRAYQGLPIEVALARLTTRPTIPDTVPVAWHGLLNAMTALEPSDRPSPDEVAAALHDLASGSDPVVAIAGSDAGSVDSDAASAPTPSGTRNAETLVDPDMTEPIQSSRAVSHWRWTVPVAAAALMFALAAAPDRSDGQRGGHPRSASVPQGRGAPLPALQEALPEGDGDQLLAPAGEDRPEGSSADTAKLTVSAGQVAVPRSRVAGSGGQVAGPGGQAATSGGQVAGSGGQAAAPDSDGQAAGSGGQAPAPDSDGEAAGSGGQAPAPDSDGEAAGSGGQAATPDSDGENAEPDSGSADNAPGNGKGKGKGKGNGNGPRVAVPANGSAGPP